MRRPTPVRWSPDALAVVSSLATELTAESAGDLLPDELAFRRALRESRGLLNFALRHKTLAVVASAAARIDPSLGISQRLKQAAAAESLRCLRAAACAAQVWQLLSDAGCEPLLIKGVALSAQTTGCLDSRGVGDVDVFVPPDKLTTAVETMRLAGAHPRESIAPQPAFAHAATVDWRETSVDIHRRLTHSPAFTPPPHRDVWLRGVEVDLGGAIVRTLHPSDAAVHIVTSSAHDSWSQLIRIADLARLLRLIAQHPGGASTRDVARSWGAARQWGLGLAMLRRLRTDLPRQDPLSEAIATRTWIWLAGERQLRLSDSLRDRASRDLYRVASGATPAYTRWWLKRSLGRLQPR